ncbi:UNVERIFIED_CONTAM: Magnesium dechelatase SGRL, chloroplastic [Sesamum calycinum]|uniref:Magnesium dechelatase SGRL, chloroplastic n=1 Tax=Sesamum calycinum TaxID=2727403 RepID=A0AAW2P8M0_9LAMI
MSQAFTPCSAIHSRFQCSTTFLQFPFFQAARLLGPPARFEASKLKRDQLKGWYSKDDVVAEWTDVNGNLFLNVHCYVSGPNSLLDMAAEFRYHIFSKELPLVLEAVVFGDSDLFREHKQLMDALVRVYFHSSSKKYNRMECWGPLKDAALGKGVDKINAFLFASKQSAHAHKFWGSPKSIFQALFTFLL